MGWFGGRSDRLDLAPTYPDGPDALAADGKLTEREVAYLEKLSAAGIDVRAPRGVTFLFVYRDRGAAERVIARFEGPQFTGMIVDIMKGSDGSAFTLSAGEFALDPGLAQWSRIFRDVEATDLSYMGWVASFPEISRRASETFLRGF